MERWTSKNGTFGSIAVPISFRTYEAVFRAELTYLNRLDLDTCHPEISWIIE
ncbi:MAG: hypothetical protein NPIRA05_11700 [Nitrospirales bacterium]|nr:MAG: hypothetical protein NPIRA05_11700 [Nitrospirales bacterium]